MDRNEQGNEHLEATLGHIRQILETASARMTTAESPEDDITIQGEASGRVVKEVVSYLGLTALEASLYDEEAQEDIIVSEDEEEPTA